jgi:hypothetical protein
MKTHKQIQNKLTEHEMQIETLFQNNGAMNLHTLISLRQGRTALLWALSDAENLIPDEITLKLDWEITRIESSNLF